MSTNKIQIVEQAFFARSAGDAQSSCTAPIMKRRQLVADLTEAQLNWQPSGGTAWSVAQCLDHLAQSNTLYTSALLAAVRSVKPGTAPRQGPIQPGWFARLFIIELEPPPTMKDKSAEESAAGEALERTRGVDGAL